MIQAKTIIPKSLSHFTAQLRSFVRENYTNERRIDLFLREETPTTAVFEIWLHGSWGFVIEGHETGPHTTRLIAIIENQNWYDIWEFMFLPVWKELLAAMDAQIPAAEPKATGGLSPRENEVFECIRNGLDRKGIAKKLGITDSTVDTDVRNICVKMNLSITKSIKLFRQLIKDRGVSG